MDGGSRISRRAFVSRGAVAVGAGVAVPFAFVPTAGAADRSLHRFVERKRREARTPGISVAVVRGDDVPT
jgi:hypothetical protein